MPATLRLLSRYCDARPTIRDGDLLLFRGSGLAARLIRTAGRTRYSHAGMAAWSKGVLLCLERREFCGGRAVTLSSQVRRFPGRLDVFAVRAEFDRWPATGYDRRGAVGAMLRKCGEPYSYVGLLAAAVLHLPFLRLLYEPDDSDCAVPRDGLPEFCSQAVATAAQHGGGVDPVPNLAARITEPGDLARSQLWRYRCTLVPDDDPQWAEQITSSEAPT